MSGNPLENPNPWGGGPPPPPPPTSAPVRPADTSRHPSPAVSFPLPTPASSSSPGASAAVPPPEGILQFGNPLQSSNAFSPFFPPSPPPIPISSASKRPPVLQGGTNGGDGGSSRFQRAEGSTHGSEGVGVGKSSVLQPLRMGHLDGRKSRPSHISLPSMASEDDHDDGGGGRQNPLHEGGRGGSHPRRGSGPQHHSMAVEKAARSAATSRRGTLSLRSSAHSHGPPTHPAHRGHPPHFTSDHPASIDSAFHDWSSEEDGEEMAGTFRPRWNVLTSPSPVPDGPSFTSSTAAKGGWVGEGSGSGEAGIDGLGRKALSTTYASASKFGRNGSPMGGSRTSHRSGTTTATSSEASASSSSEASSESSYGSGHSTLTVEYQRKERSGSRHSSGNPNREKNPFVGVEPGDRGGGSGGSALHGHPNGEAEEGEAGNPFAMAQGKAKGLGGLLSPYGGGGGGGGPTASLPMGRARRYSDAYGAEGDERFRKRHGSGEEGGRRETTADLLSSLDGGGGTTPSADRMAQARRRALSLFPTVSTSEKYRGREGAAHPELVLHAEEGWKAHSYTKVMQKGYIVLIEWKVFFMIILLFCAALVLTGLFSGIISYVRNRHVLQVEQLALDGAIAMIDAIRACSDASLTAPGTPVAEPTVVNELRTLIRKVDWERKTLEDLLDAAKSALLVQDCFTAADQYNQVFGLGYEKSTDMISPLPMHLTSYSRAWALGWTQWRSQGLLLRTEDPPISSQRAITAVASNVMCLSPLQTVSLATLLQNEYQCTADYETVLTATPVSSVNYPVVVNTMLDYIGDLNAFRNIPNSERIDLFHILAFAILFVLIVLSMVYLSRVPFSYREAEKEKAIVHKDFVVHTSHVEMQRSTLRLLDYYIWRLGAFEPISLKEAWCMGYEMSEADWERRVKELADAMRSSGRSLSGKTGEEGEEKEGGGEGREGESNEDGASLASSPSTGGGSGKGHTKKKKTKKTKDGNEEEVGLPRPIRTDLSRSKQEEEEETEKGRRRRESLPSASTSPFTTLLRRRSTESPSTGGGGGDDKNPPPLSPSSPSTKDLGETKIDLEDSCRMGRLKAETDDLHTFQGTTLKRQALERSACLARLVDNATSSLLDEESAQIQVILHKVASTLLLLRPFIPRHLLHEVFPSEWAAMKNLGPSLPFRRSHITLQEGLRSDVSVYLFISFYPFHRAEAVESTRRFHVLKNGIEKQRFLREEAKRQEEKNCLFREKNLERLYQTRYRSRRQLLTDMTEQEAIQGEKARALRGIPSRRASRAGKEEARPEDALRESSARAGDDGEDSDSDRDGSGVEEYVSQQGTSTGSSSGGGGSSGAKKGPYGMDTVRVLSSRDIEGGGGGGGGGAMRRRRGGGGHSRLWGRRGMKKRKGGPKTTGGGGGGYYEESRPLLAGGGGGGGGGGAAHSSLQQRQEANAPSSPHRPSYRMQDADGESDEEEGEEDGEEEWTVGGRLIDTQYVVKTVLDRKNTLRAWRERQMREAAAKKKRHLTNGPYRALGESGEEVVVHNVLTPAGNERPPQESGGNGGGVWGESSASHPLLPQDNFHPSGPDHAAAAAEGLRLLNGHHGGASSPQWRRFGGRPLTNGRGEEDASPRHPSTEGGTSPLLLHPSKTFHKGHHPHHSKATRAEAVTVVSATTSPPPPSSSSFGVDTDGGPPDNPGLRSKYVTEYPLSNMAAGINYVVESVFRVASVFYGDVVQIGGDGVLVKFGVEEEEEYANVLGAKHTREDNTNLHPKKHRHRRRTSSSKAGGAGDSDGGKDRRGRRLSWRGRRKSSSVSMSNTSLSTTDTFFGGATESPRRHREDGSGGGAHHPSNHSSTNSSSFLVPAEDGGPSSMYGRNSLSLHASPSGRHRSLDGSFIGGGVGGEWVGAEKRSHVQTGVREVTVRGRRYELTPAERAVRSAKVLQDVLIRYLDHSEDMFISPEYLQCPMAIVSENYSLKGRLRYHVSKHYAVLSRCIPLFFALERINIEYGADIVMTEAIKNQVEGFVLARPIHYLQVSDLNYHYMKETKTNHGLSRQSSVEPSASGSHSPPASGGRRGSASEDASGRHSANDPHRSSPSGSTEHVLLDDDALLPTKDGHGQGKGGGGEGKASGKEGRGEPAKREGVSPEDYPRFSAQGTVYALFHVAPLSEEDAYARVYAMEESHNQLRREHWRLIWEKYTAIVHLEPQIHFLRKFVHSLADSNAPGGGGGGGGGGGAAEGDDEMGFTYGQSPFAEDGGGMSSPGNRSVDRLLKGTIRPSGGVGGGVASAAATGFFGSASFTPERASNFSSRFPGSGRGGGAEEGGKKRDLTVTSTGSMALDAGSASSGAPGSTGNDGYSGSLRMDMRESSIAASIRAMRERLHDLMRELATYNNIYEYSSQEGYSCQKLWKYGHDMLLLLGETEEDIDREYGKS